MDPSEAVRSEEILSIIREKLNVIHFANTGGTILNPFLNGIASNFEKDQCGEALLKTVIIFEKILVEKKVIHSDYVVCIAKKM
ncbi:MAG: hypothetical protein P1P80_08690 [ANME-2 cluster archaeon]|nr:hypothetical protein [ANME-2 cluster archaeon]